MGIKLTRLQGERFENVGLKPTLKRPMHTTLCFARHSRETGNPDIHNLDSRFRGSDNPFSSPEACPEHGRRGEWFSSSPEGTLNTLPTATLPASDGARREPTVQGRT